MDEGTESESRIGNINEREVYYYGFKPDQNDRLFFSYCMWGYVRKRKPYPDGYLKAIQLLQAEKDEVVAIEDSSTGIHAAIQAGIDVIGYLGSGIKQDLGEATAVFLHFRTFSIFGNSNFISVTAYVI